MKKLQAAIVDDELHCIETLEYDLKDRLEDEVDIIFTCDNSVECVQNLKKLTPDILFIDIEMPGLTGFDLLKVLELEHTRVVFTTAHASHALEAIDYKPEAYLLKPVDPNDLVRVVQSIQIQHTPDQTHAFDGKLAISTTDEIELIPHSSIVYCKASNNYTDVFLADGGFKTVSKTLKVIEQQLPEQHFLRIHKSYLVNTNHIVKYRKSEGGMVILSNNDEVPISSDRKEELLSLIKKAH
ncbi:MAG: LytTR family DNA-binding domain-containing protein [Bacteroidota bacterium]